MRTCSHCGGRLKRIHRTFLERLAYMAIYECRQCDREDYIPRPYRYHFGKHCRCPNCGTYKVTRLEKPDKIDKMHTGFFNFLEKVAGGTLHSCIFCRLQFYDRRPRARRETAASAADATAVTNPPDTARSGA
jgi:rubrerythrin